MPTVRDRDFGLPVDMLTDDAIAAADLSGWRKPGQGLHARYVVRDFGNGVRFVAAVAAGVCTTPPAKQ